MTAPLATMATALVLAVTALALTACLPSHGYHRVWLGADGSEIHDTESFVSRNTCEEVGPRPAPGFLRCEED